MHYNIISSGSKGNATLVISHKTVILIDMGITLTRLNEGLEEEGFKISDIDALLITHDHADHISGLRFLSPSIMYALEGTLPTNSNVVKENIPFKIGDFTIIPFKVNHDATNPCGYVLMDDTDKLVYMTDTGTFYAHNLSFIKNPTYLIIESNHDIRMLLETDRPTDLKNRILSDHGHLCNEDSAFISLEIIGDKTKEITLAHISLEANSDDVALSTYRKVFKYKNVDINRYLVRCAKQFSSLRGGKYED